MKKEKTEKVEGKIENKENILKINTTNQRKLNYSITILKTAE